MGHFVPYGQDQHLKEGQVTRWKDSEPQKTSQSRVTISAYMFTEKKNDYTRGWQIFSVKDHAVNIFSFASHVIGVVTTNSAVIAQKQP